MADNDFYEKKRMGRGWLDFFSTVRLVKILLATFKVNVASDRIIVDGVYNVESEAFKITAGIIDLFHEEVLHYGARPVIVLFPNEDFMKRYLHDGIKEYAPLIDRLNAGNYEYIDLSDAFKSHIDSGSVSLNDIFHGHYTVIGNKIVADSIAEWLLENENIATADRDQSLGR